MPSFSGLNNPVFVLNLKDKNTTFLRNIGNLNLLVQCNIQEKTKISGRCGNDTYRSPCI